MSGLDWFPTLVAAAGDPTSRQSWSGKQASSVARPTRYLDGFDETP